MFRYSFAQPLPIQRTLRSRGGVSNKRRDKKPNHRLGEGWCFLQDFEKDGQCGTLAKLWYLGELPGRGFSKFQKMENMAKWFASSTAHFSRFREGL
jgi:hypothetical protein